MFFNKIKKSIAKPIKFAFNLKNIGLVLPLIILASILGIVPEINAILSIIVFLIQLIFGIFLSFFIVKLYLNFAGVEKNKINFLKLKNEFSDMILALLGSVAIRYLSVIFVAINLIISLLCFTFAVGKYQILFILCGAIFGTIFLISIIALPLALFYLNSGIIIGKNKLTNALKQSVDLMKNHLSYSVLRIMLLIFADIIAGITFILVPISYLIFKIIPTLPSDFIQMSQIAQQEQMTAIFMNFASVNVGSLIIIAILFLIGLTILHLFNIGFISNMYLELTKEGIKKVKPKQIIKNK